MGGNGRMNRLCHKMTHIGGMSVNDYDSLSILLQANNLKNTAKTHSRITLKLKQTIHILSVM
jgi:hypothetical protein